MNDQKLTQDFLRNSTHMVLGFVLEDGTPWAVPVKIQAWNGHEFAWDSKLDTVHSKALETNPAMSLVIFQKAGESFGQFAVYARGTGELVEARDHGMGRYKFTAEAAWINDETFVKRPVELVA